MLAILAVLGSFAGVWLAREVGARGPLYCIGQAGELWNGVAPCRPASSRNARRAAATAPRFVPATRAWNSTGLRAGNRAP
ncbi:hypothetical protein ACFP9V_17770 [Deinococcus radiopugnans]